MRVLNFTIAAALGAGCYLGYHHLFGSREGAPAGGAASAAANSVSDPTAPNRDLLAPGPILSADFPEPAPPVSTPPGLPPPSGRGRGEDAGENAAAGISEAPPGEGAPAGVAADGVAAAGGPASAPPSEAAPAGTPPSVPPEGIGAPRLASGVAREAYRTPAEPARETPRAAAEPVDLEGMAGRA